MATSKEIVGKIKNIKSTQKITQAMEMIAASKMRKAQERMQASRPYSVFIRQTIDNLSFQVFAEPHPYLCPREVKNVGFLVMSTDKGLCGGLNIGLFKNIVEKLNAWHEQGVGFKMCALGRKAESFFSKIGCNIIAAQTLDGENTGMGLLTGMIRVLLDEYLSGTIDAVYVGYNRFVNTMSQQPVIQNLLPIVWSNERKRGVKEYLYEPNKEVLLNELLNRYIDSFLYQALVENLACEQAARMLAMKNATDNAGDLIEELNFMYNKARQASITQELSEIVAGADAV